MRDFNHTVNVLVQAYMNDTLKHKYCHACAVGNIIAASLGCKIDGHKWTRTGTEIIPIWDEVFLCGGNPKTMQTINPQNYKGWAKRQIDASGYSWQELAAIERAFEATNPVMFDGLMAVVDVLAEIHNIDLKAKEEAKLLFVKV